LSDDLKCLGYVIRIVNQIVDEFRKKIVILSANIPDLSKELFRLFNLARIFPYRFLKQKNCLV